MLYLQVQGFLQWLAILNGVVRLRAEGQQSHVETLSLCHVAVLVNSSFTANYSGWNVSWGPLCWYFHICTVDLRTFLRAASYPRRKDLASGISRAERRPEAGRWHLASQCLHPVVIQFPWFCLGPETWDWIPNPCTHSSLWGEMSRHLGEDGEKEQWGAAAQWVR